MREILEACRSTVDLRGRQEHSQGERDVRGETPRAFRRHSWAGVPWLQMGRVILCHGATRSLNLEQTARSSCQHGGRQLAGVESALSF